MWNTRVHYHQGSKTLFANLLKLSKKTATKNLEIQAQKQGLQLHPLVQTKRCKEFDRLPWQKIWQTHQKHAWNWRQKGSLRLLCRPVYLLPFPLNKYSRRFAMTHRCKRCHNPSWMDVSLSKTSKPWDHTSTPLKNSHIRWHHTKRNHLFDTLIAPVQGRTNSTQGASGFGENKAVSQRTHLASTNWKIANHGSRRVPTLPNSNQHKTTGAV